jgi:hypothetical protein
MIPGLATPGDMPPVDLPLDLVTFFEQRPVDRRQVLIIDSSPGQKSSGLIPIAGRRSSSTNCANMGDIVSAQYPLCSFMLISSVVADGTSITARHRRHVNCLSDRLLRICAVALY